MYVELGTTTATGLPTPIMKCVPSYNNIEETGVLNHYHYYYYYYSDVAWFC